jgi:hypothetical protein
MRRRWSSRLREWTLLLVAIPIVGILMGGILSLPAMKVTRERDPWLTAALAVALAITVCGVGVLLRAPLVHLVAVWAFSLPLLLLARACYGSLGHNLERFGIVHGLALLMTVVVSLAARAHARTRHAGFETPPRHQGSPTFVLKCRPGGQPWGCSPVRRSATGVTRDVPLNSWESGAPDRGVVRRDARKRLTACSVHASRGS